MASKFSREWARTQPDDILRAVIRERTHHLLEEAVQAPAATSGPIHGADTVRGLLDAWQERGLAPEGDDLQWARTLLQMAESGHRPGPSVPGLAPTPTRSWRCCQRGGRFACGTGVPYRRNYWRDRARRLVGAMRL